MESLRTSFRGYDRSEVERALADLENRLATSRQSAENLTATIESLREERGMLEAKNRELRGRIKAVSDNPSYATLGAQFEEALRLGEGQAEQLTTEAKAEVDLLQQSTQAKASRMIRDAELHAQKLISDTQARVDEMRLTSEGVAADLTARANVKQAEAFEILSMARREVATALAESERRFAEIRSAQQRAMEVDRAALREYAEQTARNKAVAEEILRAREEESERENMQRHQDAVEQANRLLTEANQRAANASRRAGDAAAEAELALATAQTKATEMVADARALASGIIERAYGRTRELGDQTREHIDALLNGAVTRADRLRHERESLERYVQDVTDVRSPEMIVAEFEERMHLESDTALRRGQSQGQDEVDES